MIHLVSEGSWVKPSLPRDETQIFSNDEPLTAGSTAWIVKVSMQLYDLMDLCVTLSSKVSNLEVDFKKTKMLCKELQDQVKQLQVKKEDQIDSSSSSDLDDFYVALRNSSKHGRKMVSKI